MVAGLRRARWFGELTALVRGPCRLVKVQLPAPTWLTTTCNSNSRQNYRYRFSRLRNFRHFKVFPLGLLICLPYALHQLMYLLTTYAQFSENTRCCTSHRQNQEYKRRLILLSLIGFFRERPIS